MSARTVSRQRLWQIAHPAKYAAQVALQDAVRKGVLTRPASCSKCDDECVPHGHHEDYSKPLVVVWLCGHCHMARHREMRAPMLEAKRERRREQERREARERVEAKKAARTIEDVAVANTWSTRRYSDEDLLDSLRRLAIDGKISTKRFIEDRGEGDPCPSMFEMRFGSWAAAVRAAGLTPGETRRTYWRKGNDELAAGIRRAMEFYGRIPTVSEYEAFRAENPGLGLACSALVRRRLGRWADCLRLAQETEMEVAA